MSRVLFTARIGLILGICFNSWNAFSQPLEVKKYPRQYFRNPLGIPIELSANFGELRPNHWHMGLDIRTNQKEDLPVYAAAEGYIAKIGIRAQSFGRFIVVNHPNGLSTLYGHLNDFYPQLEAYVTEQQYGKESWALELDLPKTKFPVYKGQFLAYSGNTGGSQGPHLHFEIFDTKTTKRLNPLLVDFSVKDDVRPSLIKLAVYDRSHSVLEQTPRFYPLKNTDSGYILPKIPVLQTGLNKLSFAIQAFDKMSGSTNPNGVYSAVIFFDEEPLVGFTLDSIDYDDTEYMNAQIDYHYRHNGGTFLQHLSRLPGDKGAVYHTMNGDGVIHLPDTNIHQIRIEVKDANMNVSNLNFALQYNDSLSVPSDHSDFPIHFAPNQPNALLKPDFELYLGKDCLYDTLQPVYSRNYLVYPGAVSAIHQVNDGSIPLHGYCTVRIKPTEKLPDSMKDKLVIQRTYRGNRDVRKAVWKENQGSPWLEAQFSELGSFQAFYDNTPPQINSPGSGDTIDLSPESRIVFTPTDDFGAIKDFRAELNGNWLRFTNDKSRSWTYVFDERVPFGVHHLKVTAGDLAGNTTVKEWWFKKYPYTPPRKKIIKKKGKGKKTGKKKK
jgi:hypothetical protein